MKKVLMFLAFSFIGNAGLLSDFTEKFVCNIYSVHSAEYKTANTMNKWMFVEYKYVNNSLKLIDTYRNRLDYKGKQGIDELTRLFKKKRNLLDDLVGVNKDITLSNLSLLYNIYKDNDMGVAKDIFNIYGLDRHKILKIANRMDRINDNIKDKVLDDFTEIDPMIESIRCY